MKKFKKEIVILDELKSLIPPLREIEFEQLKSNILAEGIRESIKVWNQNDNFIIIDGHNRFKISKDCGIDFNIDILDFPNIGEVKKWMINFQLGRRNLTSEQMSYLRGILYNEFKQDATQNILQKPHLNEIDPSGQNDHSTDYNGKVSIENDKKTAQILSEQYNVSEKTIRRDAEFAKGLDKLDNELKADVLSGKAKIKKSDVQKLAKFDASDKIESIDDVQDLIQHHEIKKIVPTAEAVAAAIEEQETQGEKAKISTKQAFELVKQGNFVEQICVQKFDFITKMTTKPTFKVYKEVTVRLETEEKTRFGEPKPQRRRFDAVLLVKPFYSAFGNQLFSIGVEIKTSKLDLLKDAKFTDYLGFTNYMFFAVPEKLVQLTLQKCENFENIGVINIKNSVIVKMPTFQDVSVENSEALLRQIAYLLKEE